LSKDAITTTSVGEHVSPQTTDEWREWVSASSTRNFMLHNPLLDWLELCGNQHGFIRDDEREGYDASIDFTQFLMGQGNAFEAAVVGYLRTLQPIVVIGSGHADVQNLRKAEETFDALQAGEPILHQAVLRDPDSKTYGAPDFLIRSDILNKLFPGTLADDEAALLAPDLGDNPWHYVVVDAKFTTLQILGNGGLGNNGSKPAYKAQVYVYNRALGRLQGYLPTRSFLLGRGWEQGFAEKKQRGSSAMGRLGSVPQDQEFGDRPIGDWAQLGAEWVRRARSEGSNWRVLPEPSIPELWPNMGQTSDFPWHEAKSKIASELSDLTLLWQVSAEKRDRAHLSGIRSWRDSQASAVSLGVTGDRQGPTLQAMLDVNQTDDGPAVRPERINAARDEWGETPKLEFYVDFETVSDLADDFSTMPERGGQPLIFMIGCGHIENGAWVFESFVTDDLSQLQEERIIDDWFAHMADVTAQLSPGTDPPVFHWSHAEVSFLEKSYNAAKRRQGRDDWPTPRWFDFLTRVARQEPLVVRGSLKFGLKSVAKAMHAHGLIESSWDDSPLDGLGAMVGAWSAAKEADAKSVTLIDVPLMQEVAAYNEVDCKVMMEIVRYLRANH